MERIEELDETSDIQAVVAAVRNRADEIRGNLGPKDLWEERVERADELMEIADRIEAARLRERELLKANIARVRELEGMLDSAANTLLGCAIRQKKSEAETANVAKLRAALEVVLDECCHHLCAIPDQLAEGGQTCDWRCVMPGRCEAIDKAKAALAAQPRNCDRFPTYVDAVAYFNKHNQPLRADPRPNLIDGKKYEDFSEWYADTAPQEGGKP